MKKYILNFILVMAFVFWLLLIIDAMLRHGSFYLFVLMVTTFFVGFYFGGIVAIWILENRT